MRRPLIVEAAHRAGRCRARMVDLHDVPRANIRFLPIRDAWFSGSMNYLGTARRADGSPEYEATVMGADHEVYAAHKNPIVARALR